MASETEIVNGALGKLGLAPVLSLDDDRVEARHAKETFGRIRDAVLRDHPWNFATARAALPAEVASPVWGYTYAYNLPADPYCLRVLEIENVGDLPWKVEGRQILTDIGAPLNLTYIKRITDTSVLDAMCVDALETRCAAEWAEKLVRSTQVKAELLKEYGEKIRGTRSRDGQEGSREPISDASWISVRY